MKAVRSQVFALILLVTGLRAPAGAQVPFLRGDINLDGRVSIADSVPFECILFCALLPDLPCADAADINDDGNLDVRDLFALLIAIFSEGGTIVAPFPEVGPDPTGDSLGCERYEPVQPPVTDDVVELGHATALAGERVSLPLLIQSPEDIAAFQLVVRYDPATFTPVLPQEAGMADAFLEGTVFDTKSGNANFSGYLSLVTFPAEGIFRLGFFLFPPLFLPPANHPVHALNIVGEVAKKIEPGRRIELSFAEQATPFGALRTELVPEFVPSAVARPPGTQRPGSITVAAPVLFVRGDSNLDGEINISDAIQILGFLFLGTVDIACRDAADVDDNGRNELSDSIGLLDFLFVGGLPPQQPWPHCGADASEDGIGCEGYPKC